MASLNVSAYFADGRSVTFSGDVADSVVHAAVAPLVEALSAPSVVPVVPPADESEDAPAE